MIETPNAVDQVDRIAAVDGITGVVLGSADLSLASGNPGNQAASAIRDSIRRLEEAASSAGVACGIATGENPETIAQLITYHTSFVVYSVDIRLYARAVDEAARKLREVLSYRPQKVIDPKGQALTETSDG
jgi:4-hydroxy-2-oxoheptanedioate aldolase